MFRAACGSHRLDILRFLVTNGFDLQHASMRNVLHETVDGIADDDAEGAECAQALIRFLLDNGVDVNWQRKGDLLTALHIACQKGLYGIAYLLVLYGADVNAIALVCPQTRYSFKQTSANLTVTMLPTQHDEMPLTCAKKASQSPDQSQRQKHESDLLINFLVENHARETWRRQPAPRAANVSSTTTLSGQQVQTNGFVPADSNAPRGKILSFSGCVSFQCTGLELDEDTPTQGLMFDTPM